MNRRFADLPICRFADLPICRFADLPICRFLRTQKSAEDSKICRGLKNLPRTQKSAEDSKICRGLKNLPVKDWRKRVMTRGVGRPSKLNPEVTKKICDFIRLGHTYEVACQLSGIAQSTFNNWREKGKEQKTGQYVEFLEAVNIAIVESESIHVRQVVAAATQSKIATETRRTQKTDGTVEVVTTEKEVPPDWSASRFILERRFNERWGARKAVELSTEDDKPLPIAIIDMSLDEL